MTSTRYLPPSNWRDRIAPTEMDPWRGRVLRGDVHDENAAAMDGVSGHAGLFSSATDLLTFAEWLLAGAVGRSGGQSLPWQCVRQKKDPLLPDRPPARPSDRPFSTNSPAGRTWCPDPPGRWGGTLRLRRAAPAGCSRRRVLDMLASPALPSGSTPNASWRSSYW